MNTPAPKNLPALLKKIRACTLCEDHLPMGANPVLRVSSTAAILIAGQAPGIRVHESSIPFDDPSGDRLRKWMGIGPNEFYDQGKIAIVPMGFCYPGTGTNGDLPPRPECAKTWHPCLTPQLSGIKLTLAIGAYAQKYYLGKRRKGSLTETVACWKEYLPEIIPLPHPSPRNNIWLKRNPWFELELIPEIQQRVMKLLTIQGFRGNNVVS